MSHGDNIGFTPHDHSACISDTLRVVDRLCAKQGLQFTPVRRRVMEILLQQHRAMAAYDILDQLREDGLGSQPPVVYRALDFLVKHGFAHRIERLNAFAACAHPGDQHAPAFLICRGCDRVSETHTDPVSAGLGHAARAAGFEIERTMVEAMGLCPDCREEEAQ